MRKDQEKYFLEIHSGLYEPVFRHCYIRVTDREKAKDLAQETFIRVWKFIQNGGQIDNVRAFTYKIANNLIIDEYRKHKTESLDELEEKGFEIAGEDDESVKKPAETANALRVISRIDSKYRDVLIMRYVDDLTIGEIARIVGETENTVSVRIHRGMNMIKEMIK